VVQEDVLTTEDLLEQWREAVRASELADRLAKLALESVERADQSALGAEEIARMAERAAKAAERAATSARQAAERAAAFARDSRAGWLSTATQAVAATTAEEQSARSRYEDSAREAGQPPRSD
jgi:hypothetical protein